MPDPGEDGEIHKSADGSQNQHWNADGVLVIASRGSVNAAGGGEGGESNGHADAADGEHGGAKALQECEKQAGAANVGQQALKAQRALGRRFFGGRLHGKNRLRHPSKDCKSSSCGQGGLCRRCATASAQESWPELSHCGGLGLSGAPIGLPVWRVLVTRTVAPADFHFQFGVFGCNLSFAR